MAVLDSTAVEAARASLAEDGRSLAALSYPDDRYGRPQEVLIVADHEGRAPGCVARSVRRTVGGAYLLCRGGGRTA